MLFIESKTLKHEGDTTDEMRLSALDKLRANGASGLIRSARLGMFETLAEGDEERAREIERALAAANEDAGEPFIKGDLFIEDGQVLFLVFGDGASESSVRAGIIYTKETNDPAERLERFCDQVSDALEAKSEWRASAPPETEGFAHLARADSSVAASGQNANGDEAARWRAAELLQDAAARRFLRRTQEAHADNRTADLRLNATVGDDDASVENEFLIERLTDARLLRREILISCRQSGRALFRLPSADALSVITASRAVCSECGKDIGDEKIEELVAPTALAAELLDDGTWLVARLRLILQSLGLSEKDVMVAAAAGEMSDAETKGRMTANVGGEMFLFYMRDGDLTAKDARRALDAEAEGAHLVFVATGKIETEARVLLREYGRRRTTRGEAKEIIIVEGVEAAGVELQHAFDRVALRKLSENLCELNASAGFDLARMIYARFRTTGRTESALEELATSAIGALSGRI